MTSWPPPLSRAARRVAFDAYVIVDWSASKAPVRGADSVWWALASWRDGELVFQRVENPSTRAEAEGAITAELVRLVRGGASVLIGFDFPYAYPVGTAQALGLEGAPWRAIWREVAAQVIDEQEARANNRFEVAAGWNRRMGGPGPFWGLPNGLEVKGLTRKKPALPWVVPEYRLSERRVRGPKSAFQLVGAGAVGSQTLMGLPVLERLREHPELAPVSLVWPFETGPLLPQRKPGMPRVVHAEIYPSLVRHPVPDGWVKDRAQVVALAWDLAKRDATGELEALFEAPAALYEAERRRVVEEEGWILGVS